MKIKKSCLFLIDASPNGSTEEFDGYQSSISTNLMASSPTNSLLLTSGSTRYEKKKTTPNPTDPIGMVIATDRYMLMEFYVYK